MDQEEKLKLAKIFAVLRGDIDRIDQEMIALLAERNQVTLEIGLLKKQANLAINKKDREEEMMIARHELAHQLHIELGFIEEIFTLIIAESKRIQKVIAIDEDVAEAKIKHNAKK